MCSQTNLTIKRELLPDLFQNSVHVFLTSVVTEILYFLHIFLEPEKLIYINISISFGFASKEESLK